MTARRLPPVASIRIDLSDPDSANLWRTVAKVASELGDSTPWCLVGGLMVALFALEAGQRARPTTDIDILGDARSRPSGTEEVTRHLKALGAEIHEYGGLERERGFRFNVDGQVVDVLAPDGLPIERPPLTTGNLQTLQIPGGTQALRRTELVEIVLDGHATPLKRPTLLGAIILKARSLLVHSRIQDQREDLITLLSLVPDAFAMRDELTKAEVKWLRQTENRLDFDDPGLPELSRAGDPARARDTFAALVGG